jgi:ankyrin repeat protein
MDQVQICREIRDAIRCGATQKAVELIESDSSLFKVMTPFGTWLHVAAAFGQLDIVKRLVLLGASVSRNGGILGGNPLNQAASKGHLDVVRYLLSCGGDMDISEPQYNPLFSAIYGGHTAVAKLLIEAGINTRIRYSGEYMKDMDALAFAREWGRSDIAELLTAGSR